MSNEEKIKVASCFEGLLWSFLVRLERGEDLRGVLESTLTQLQQERLLVEAENLLGIHKP